MSTKPEPRTCGNCHYAHELAGVAGVVEIGAELRACFGVPPTVAILGMDQNGNAGTITARPQVRPSEPACSLWQPRAPSLDS